MKPSAPFSVRDSQVRTRSSSSPSKSATSDANCHVLQMLTPHSGSQISASSCSPSLLSEPPDVRRWFSSYVYESPSLGTSEGFLGSVLDESERENNGCVVDDGKIGGGGGGGEATSRGSNCIRGRGRGRDRLGAHEFAGNFGSNELVEESPTEVPDSLESSLQISEPPDVGEWFSSYVYESPELSECSREFVSGESECKKEGPFTGESKKEHGNSGEVTRVKDGDAAGALEVPHANGLVCNGGGSFINHDRDNQTPTKIADSMTPSLPLSEPPDITNWFSSYVYESPELSTFPGSPVEDNGDVKDDLILKNVIGEKEDNQHNLSGKRIAGGTGINERLNSVLGSSSHEDLEHEYQHTLDEIPCPKITDGRMEFKALLNNDWDCKNKRPKQLHSEEAILFHSNINENSSNGKRKACRELIGRFEEGSGLKAQNREVAHTLLDGDLGLSPVNQTSTRRSTHGGHDKENNRRDNDSTSFVSIRRKEATSASDELTRPRRALHQCSHAKGNVLSAAIEDEAKMKPLSEITNFQSSFDVQESAGKWKCPQKRKPILGPPMKQLRLERWINRI
ncbi:uncharacterized protein LOC104441948 isoform X2 [Eucalyptus grandis]|uniref:uncharacterized protein LOC104441948 isoform X2 n=1 Tax=Eucalyptus grandis TaxID=71139 RepID=UPI00192EFB69|nr:uncharacterized protein LOC104441948 isoform X2 [Eucalyptus grandis]